MAVKSLNTSLTLYTLQTRFSPVHRTKSCQNVLQGLPQDYDVHLQWGDLSCRWCDPGCYLLIAVGAILAIMGFLGCCGAITESKCMLLTFFIIVLLIFIAEVAGAIVVFVFQPLAKELLQKVSDSFVLTIRENYGEEKTFTSLMNDTMTELKCCGFNNYTDFDGSPFLKNTSHYPVTCCLETSTACSLTEASEQEVKGCFDAILDLLEDNAALLGGVALGIAALEIAAMVVSMVLYNNVGK
ncbi:tetraspanin-1-like [Astyanax mexicanus]|uniref:Tetraspanin-1-like n=1 Tax=Astyanax mexicanus TaxID=7994 RepID=A0A8T2KT78_ASTMX|nr:tetraspanin-1-like [Astyanax mexicanus]